MPMRIGVIGAGNIGGNVGEPSRAAEADVVVLSVPWGVIDAALAAAGPLSGKTVVDTTNQFASGGALDLGHTAARHNADRLPGARYTKCVNTLTARFQAEAATRSGDARVVQWLCGDDAEAKAILGQLVDDAGYVPVDLGGIDGCTVMEAPRRPGAVYGEEYRASDALAVLEAVRAGRPIPPTPAY